MHARSSTAASTLDAEFRSEFERAGRSRRFDSGEMILHTGDVSRSVHLIRKGAAKIVRWTHDGNEVVIDERRSGQLLGEFGAIDALPRSASAVALGRVETVELSSEAFLALLDRHPRAALPLLREMSRLLRTASETRVALRSGDVVGRIAARLTELAESAGSVPPISVQVRHEDLAAWASVNRETATRALGRLRDEGLIQTGRGRVEVIDPAGLARRALDI
jgi:CRP-like cAMP-binding protein